MTIFSDIAAWLRSAAEAARQGASEVGGAVVCADCVREADRFTPASGGLGASSVEPPVAEFGDYSICARCVAAVTRKTPARLLRRFVAGMDCHRCPVCHATVPSHPVTAFADALLGTEHRCDPAAIARVLSGSRV